MRGADLMESVLSGKEAKAESKAKAEKPEKEVSEVHVKKVKKAKGKGHSYRITNHHTHPAHPPEEYNAEDVQGVQDHIEQHMGEGEEAGQDAE